LTFGHMFIGYFRLELSQKDTSFSYG